MATLNAAKPDTKEFAYYKDWFLRMASISTTIRKLRKEEQDFYFGDVEKTRTQFTKAQLEQIQDKYDIPISTKINYAIIEQFLALLTGNKPYPKLVAPNDSLRETTMAYEKAFHGVWYESYGNDQITATIRDVLTVGSGYMMVRKSNFVTESTFNVIIENIPWQYVFVDPTSIKPDFSDAEIICIGRVMPVTKAEAEYDIDVEGEDFTQKDAISGLIDWSDIELPYFSGVDNLNNKSKKFCWVREFYEKKTVWVYISDTGDVTDKKPKPISVPNPEREALAMQIIQLRQSLQKASSMAEQSAEMAGNYEQVAVSQDEPTAAISAMGNQDAVTNKAAQQVREGTEQLQQMMIAHKKMPPMVPAYSFVRLDGTEVIARSFTKVKEKHIKRTLCVGNHIVEREVLSVDEYPIIHFCVSHNRSPNKTYSITHYIKDVVKAFNKFWAIAIYDAQLHGQRKVIAEESTVIDQTKWQQDWATPGAMLTYKANPIVSDGGKPQIMDAAPLNQAYTQLFVLLQNLIEYITGMFASMQGSNEGMPDTMGGLQSLQTMGSQRVKLYSRYNETAIEKLAYVVVSYLQQYAPKDEILKYVDENGDQHELQLMSDNTDLRYKVRVNLTANLPTTRHLAAQLLASVSGQTANPAVADLLTQYMIKMLDMPEGDEILQKIDTVNNLQQQLSSTQQQMDMMQKKINMMENNQMSSDLANKQKIAEMEIEQDKERAMRENEEAVEGEAQIPSISDL